MSARAAFQTEHPDVFFLDQDDLPAIARRFEDLNWLNSGETLLSAERAGEGNMNYTLRIRTSERSFILKQARPWVEKYSHIAAPWDRALTEGRFYAQIRSNRVLASLMPALLGFDPDSRMLMLEDLGASQDFTSIYREGRIASDDLRRLIAYLLELHRSTRDPALGSAFSNREMRRLNHEHIFSLPLRPENGLNLDAITPGLSDLARSLQYDREYSKRVATLGELYLNPGLESCLLHGDYFPGSWLRVADGVRIIDPEFCFFGPPEFDLGVMVAHLHMAAVAAPDIAVACSLYTGTPRLSVALMQQFAGVEIMRRLIGVAQLPLHCGLDEKRRLLELSRALVLGVSA